jgi:hypothetical protein
MTKEDLTPEQLDQFNKAMKESRIKIRNIIVGGVLTLLALSVFNYIICKNYMPQSAFVVQFLTTILMFSGTRSDLVKEADRFTEEAQKILNQ